MCRRWAFALNVFVIALVNSRYINFEAVRMKTIIIAYIKNPGKVAYALKIVSWYFVFIKHLDTHA